MLRREPVAVMSAKEREDEIAQQNKAAHMRQRKGERRGNMYQQFPAWPDERRGYGPGEPGNPEEQQKCDPARPFGHRGNKEGVRRTFVLDGDDVDGVDDADNRGSCTEGV